MDFKVKYSILIIFLVIILAINLLTYNVFWKQTDIGNFHLKGRDNWYLPSQSKQAD